MQIMSLTFILSVFNMSSLFSEKSEPENIDLEVGLYNPDKFTKLNSKNELKNSKKNKINDYLYLIGYLSLLIRNNNNNNNKIKIINSDDSYDSCDSVYIDIPLNSQSYNYNN